MRNVRLPPVVSRCVLTVALIVGGGCSKWVEVKPPAVGASVQLAAVDGKPLPLVITSTAGDSTFIEGGTAVIGEALAGGPYTLSLRHLTGTTTVLLDVFGNTDLIADGSTMTATIDMGVILGKHVYTFSF